MKSYIIIAMILFTGFFIEGCDPGYAFIVSNKTANTISIQIIDPNRSLEHRDSIMVYDTLISEFSGNNIKRKAPVNKDNFNNSYSFMLSKYEDALVEYGIGSLRLNQKIIIDEKDTLLLEDQPRLTRAGPFMSKRFILTLR